MQQRERGQITGLLWSRRGKYCSAQTNDPSVCLPFSELENYTMMGEITGKTPKNDKIVIRMSFSEKERGGKGNKTWK